MLNMILFFVHLAFGASDSTNAFEKTYARDNTFCNYKNMRVEFLIRGSNKFTEPKEAGYGEFIFFRKPGKKPKLLELNEFRSDTVKFFLGSSPHCSKTHGYHIESDTIAVLFLKENRPFKDKLIIQLFDFKTLLPKQHIETNYPTDRAQKIDNGFTFRTLGENTNLDIGKIQFENETYIFQEKDFPIWVNYTIKGFEVSPDQTFLKFPWKKAFKDKEDFFTASGWKAAEQKFSNKFIFVAVNHKLKRTCLLFLETKAKITGAESWRCQAM